jgi:pyruvate ferredoxin oxidoreductase beta subunit
VAAHNIPYAAQTAIHNWRDVTQKAEKAFAANGPSFINIMAPCHRGWRYPMEETIQLARLSFETCIWPLYEVENGEWRLTAKPKQKKPVEDFLKIQGRFRHLFQPENEGQIAHIQAFVDAEWEKLRKRCGE